MNPTTDEVVMTRRIGSNRLVAIGNIE